MIMYDLISKLSEMRSEYNCFDEDEEPKYRALSEAIEILSKRADGDTISRQSAMDALTDENIINHMDSAGDGDLHRCKRAMERILAQLPAAHRPVDEWCTDCSEYDSDKHCCPRFNRVIRSAVGERKHGKWIDLHPQGDSRFMCSVCKWKEHVPTCMGKPTVWEYCPSCGARMDDDNDATD